MTQPSGQPRSRLPEMHARWYDTLPHILWCADAGGDTTFVNAAWAEYTGHSRASALGFCFADFIHPDDREGALTRWANAWIDGRPYHSEFRLRRFDGEHRWFASQGRPLVGDGGGVGAWIGSCTDIHERRLAEEQNALWAQVFAAAPWGVAISDPGGARLADLNPAFAAMHGHAPHELQGRPIAGLFAEDCPGLVADKARAMQERGHFTFENRHRRQDGSTFPVEVRATRLDGGGQGCAFTVTDISARVQAQAQLQAALDQRSEEGAWLRQLLQDSPVGILAADATGRLLEANPAFLEMLGYTQADLEAGLHWPHLTPLEFADLDARASQELKATGRVRPYEKQYLHKNGGRVPVLIGATLLQADHPHGVGARAVGYVVDLRQAKRSGDLLSRMLARTAALQRVTVALAGASDQAGVLRALFEQGCAAVGATQGLVALQDASGAALELVGHVGMPQASMQERRRAPVPLTAKLPAPDAVRGGQAVYLPTRAAILAAYPQLAGEAQALRAQACAALPTSVNGAGAALLLFFPHGQAFDAQDRAFLTTLAAQVGQALTRVALVDALRVSQARAAALAESATALLAPLSRAETLDACIRLIQTHLGASLCAVTERSKDGARLRLVAHAGYPQALMDRWPAIGLEADTPTSQAARDAAGLYFADFAAWAQAYPEVVPVLQGLRFQASAYLPLRAHDRVIGVLTLHFPEGRAFDPGERQFIEALATQCAVALDRAALIEAERVALAQADHDRAVLREQSLRLRLALEASTLGIWSLDLASGRVERSPELLRLLGSGRALIDMPEFLDSVHPEDRAAVQARFERALAGGETHFTLRHRYLRGDGQLIWLQQRSLVERDVQGQAIRIIGTSEDITREVEAQQLLLNSRTQLSMALESANMGLWDLDLSAKTVQWGGMQEQLFGVAPGGFEGTLEAVMRRIHPDDRAAVLAATTAARRAGPGGRFEVEFRALLPDGGARWLRGIGKVGQVADGEVTRMIGVDYDVSARKQVEAELRDGKARLEAALEYGQLGLWEHDLSSGLTHWSGAMSELYGVPTDDPVGDMTAIFAELLHPEDHARVLQATAATAAHGRPLDEVFRVVRPDGQQRWIRSTARLLRAEDGTPLKLLGVNYDFTERRAAELALEGLNAELERRVAERTRELEAIIESMPDAVYVGGVGGISRANQAALDMLGFTDLADMNQNIMHLAERAQVRDPDTLERLQPGEEPFMVALGGQAHTRDELVRHLKNGEDRLIRVAAAPVVLGGAVLGAVAVVSDHTERRRQEADLRAVNVQLLRSNTELERFAYVASHDLQEPIRTVGSFAGLLGHKYGAQLDDTGQRYLDLILQGSARMKTLVDDLLTFSRLAGERRELRPVALGEVLAEALARLQARLAASGGQFSHGPLPTVLGDAPQLAQLLQNLIGNALKFTREDAPAQVRLSAEREDQFWHFQVRDNGIGIEPAYLHKVFELFQRLHGRERYEGSGLGLAICQKIVETHGGRIWAESVPGVGSTFHFTLPAAG